MVNASGVGKTKDAGWEIGVSRTLPLPAEQVWSVLTSPEGLAIWLGKGADPSEGTGTWYETVDGTAGEIRSFRPLDRMRLTWQPPDWDHESTVQVAIRANGPAKTVLRFHQERLANAAERERQRAHWQEVMQQLLPLLGVDPG